MGEKVMASMFCTKIYECRNREWCARDFKPGDDPECFEVERKYDRIVSMPPEELAKYIDLHTAEAMWCKSPPDDCPPHEECVKCIFEWLMSPVEEENA